MEIKKVIDLLESLIKNSSEGLPKEIFFFMSKITSIVNVDLLIKKRKESDALDLKR